MTHQQRFEALRDVAYALEGEARWSALVEVLDAWPEPELREVAIPYLEEALWDDISPRLAPQRWVQQEGGVVSLHPALVFARTLVLPRFGLGSEGVRALVSSPHAPPWRHLDLSHNQIGAEGAVALASAPGLLGLSHLNLGYNELGDAGIQALVNSPHLRELLHLDVRYNRIREAGTRALARSPHMSSLDYLNLEGNSIGEGVYDLADSMELSGLTRLELSLMEVSLDGARALAESRYLDPRLCRFWRRQLP